MEFRDLKAQYLANQTEIDSAIQNVLHSGHFIGGEPVGLLEKQLAEYVGVKHCITCANGTDALQLALMAWKIGKKDAVFVPDFTFFSSGEIAPWVDAVPVFVDVDKNTFNMSVTSLENAILKVIQDEELIPKVIIAVDLFGQPAEHEAIRKIAQKYNMYVLEDGAQGFGGSIGDKKACSFGDISTTSFFPAKPLGCYGDGGAVFTDNDEWAALIRSYKVHGKGNNKYDNVRIGMNSRLDTIQAAVLSVKLSIFQEQELEAVNRVAKWYDERLTDADVVCPQVLEGYYSSWAQYTVVLPKSEMRDILMERLTECGIPSMIYYVKPMHEQLAFEDIMKKYTDWGWGFNNTKWLCKHVLSLPMHPYLKEEEVSFICDTIRKCLGSGIK